jgi:hypothetical protein
MEKKSIYKLEIIVEDDNTKINRGMQQMNPYMIIGLLVQEIRTIQKSMIETYIKEENS